MNSHVCIRVLLCCLLFISAMVPAAAAEKKLVRVGYYENDNFQAGAAEDLAKYGYSYEYLQKLQLYTNWSYSYVYGEYGDLYQKLLDGDIDILTGLAYRAERAELIGYPELAMGDTLYSFLKRETDTDITSNPKTIAGRKIGVLDGAMKSVVEKYLSRNGITAELVLFQDVKARDRALMDGRVDITIVEGSTTNAMEGIAAFAEAGETDYFVCVNKRRGDILEDLNQAQLELFNANPKIKADLANKWLRQNTVSATITEKEHKWLSEHKTFTVGFYDSYLPFAAKDEKGNVTGIIKDLMPAIFASLKAEDMEIRYKSYPSYDDMLQAVRHHEVDAIFPAYAEYWSTEKQSLVPTEPVINSYFNLVFNKQYPDIKTAKLALRRSNGFGRAFASVEFPKNEILLFDTVEECLDAVVKGDADAAILNGLRTDYLLRSKDSYRQLVSAQIVHEAPLGFAVDDSRPEIVALLNHGINLLPQDFALIHAAQYEARHPMTVADFIKSHLGISMALVVLIIGLIGLELRKNKLNLAREEQQKTALEEKVREISALNISLNDQKKLLMEATEAKEAQLEEISALYEQLQENQEKMQIISAEQEEHISKISELNTQLEESRVQADAANEAKTSFLFNMSHDIRTPMNAIIGFTNLLSKNLDNKEVRGEYIEKIQSSNEFLLSLVNNVLEMARIESGKTTIDEAYVNANEMMATVTDVFETQMKDKDITFIHEAEIEHPHVLMDAMKIREIFLNLLSNAYKYTPKGGTVTLKVKELPYEREGYVLYQAEVSDTGIGMPADFLPHIFDAFTRERTTTQSGIMGTGLGMQIVKKLVDMLGGTIEVKSELGRGSSFILQLPHRRSKKKHDDTAVKKAEYDYSLFRGMHVLMAEDNDLNAEIATFILEDNGFTVEHVLNGVECVDRLGDAPAGTYDFILMDIQMPHIDGYKTTQTIRGMKDKQKASIPIIAMTANAFQEDKCNALLAGMNGHVTKPFEIDLILETIYNVLTHRNDFVRSNDMAAFEGKYTNLGCRVGRFIYGYDTDEIIYISHEVLKMFGCDTEAEFRDFIGSSFSSMVHADELETLLKEIADQQSSSDEAIDYVEYNIVRKDGAVRHVVDMACLVFNGSEKVYCVAIADITDCQQSS